MAHPLRLAALLILAGWSGGAAAQNLRCKNDFAQIGDSKLSVIEKCGEPALKDSFCKTAAGQDTRQATTQGTVLKLRGCEKIDEWSYKPGSGQFVTILRFEQGALAGIRYGDRIP